MKKILTTLGAASILALTCTPASAVYNATIQGTLEWVEQHAGNDAGAGAGTIRFRLTNQPTVNCGGWNYFAITTAVDDQVRKNMLAMLLAAKTSGAPVMVAYDSAGTGCTGYGDVIVYYLRIV